MEYDNERDDNETEYDNERGDDALLPLFLTKKFPMHEPENFKAQKKEEYLIEFLKIYCWMMTMIKKTMIKILILKTMKIQKMMTTRKLN